MRSNDRTRQFVATDTIPTPSVQNIPTRDEPHTKRPRLMENLRSAFGLVAESFLPLVVPGRTRPRRQPMGTAMPRFGSITDENRINSHQPRETKTINGVTTAVPVRVEHAHNQPLSRWDLQRSQTHAPKQLLRETYAEHVQEDHTQWQNATTHHRLAPCINDHVHPTQTVAHAADVVVNHGAPAAWCIAATIGAPYDPMTRCNAHPLRARRLRFPAWRIRRTRCKATNGVRPNRQCDPVPWSTAQAFLTCLHPIRSGKHPGCYRMDRPPRYRSRLAASPGATFPSTGSSATRRFATPRNSPIACHYAYAMIVPGTPASHHY